MMMETTIETPFAGSECLAKNNKREMRDTCAPRTHKGGNTNRKSPTWPRLWMAALLHSKSVKPIKDEKKKVHSLYVIYKKLFISVYCCTLICYYKYKMHFVVLLLNCCVCSCRCFYIHFFFASVLLIFTPICTSLYLL